MVPSNFPPPSSSRVDSVTLRANDPLALAAFYETTIGLQRLETSAAHVVLGIEGRAVLSLRKATAPALNKRSAGLFHIAFLLPDRAALAAWLRHTADTRVLIDGAADHGVSEAIYLTDPEGNGIEMYADHPPEVWRRTPDGIEVVSEHLDLQNLMEGAVDIQWQGMPSGSMIGHIHLSVTDTPTAHTFWSEQMSMSTMAGAPNVGFLSWEGYHHHIAVNSWGMRGAGLREQGAPGLEDIVFVRQVMDPVDPLARPMQMVDPTTGVKIIVKQISHPQVLQSPRAAISDAM